MFHDKLDSMKKLIFTALIIILLPLIAHAESAIVFSATEYNLGEVIEGSLAEHSFTFTNKGTSELVIHKVMSS